MEIMRAVRTYCKIHHVVINNRRRTSPSFWLDPLRIKIILAAIGMIRKMTHCVVALSCFTWETLVFRRFLFKRQILLAYDITISSSARAAYVRHSRALCVWRALKWCRPPQRKKRGCGNFVFLNVSQVPPTRNWNRENVTELFQNYFGNKCCLRAQTRKHFSVTMFLKIISSFAGRVTSK